MAVTRILEPRYRLNTGDALVSILPTCAWHKLDHIVISHAIKRIHFADAN